MQTPCKIYIKLKRQKSTYFLQVSPTDGIEHLKKKLTLFYKIEQPDIRLYLGTRLLDDKSNIHDQDVRNNSTIYFKLKKNTGEWEESQDIVV